MQASNLSSVFRAGALLTGSSKPEGASDLKSILLSRLSLYYDALGREEHQEQEDTLEIVQLKTAQEALSVVEAVQRLLAGTDASKSQHPVDAHETAIGTRDLAQVRTLLSIVFNWAIQPLLAHVIAAIPTVIPGARRRTEVNIIDLTTVPDDYKLLSELASRLIVIILPKGIEGPSNTTLISNVLLDRHLTDLLRPCIVLGWLPKSAASESVSPIDELRPMVVHIINLIPVSRSITALSALLADSSALPYVRKSCSYLLSRQLLRREGVDGLLTALFSEGDIAGDDAPLEKLENVAKLLSSLPAGMLDTLLAILSSETDSTPPTHRRAAAFSLSGLMFGERSPNRATVSRILMPALQMPFLQNLHSLEPGTSASPGLHMTALQTVRVLETLLTNTDPSPVLISGLLTPIIPSVYALSAKLERVKISDPALKAIVRGLLSTWGRLVETSEGVATVWLIVNGEGGEWQVDVAGEIARVEEFDEPPGLALFTPEDLQRAEEAGELDMDANILNLRPDPSQFVTFLKSLDRPDIISEVFVKLLEAYRETKAVKDSDPMRTLLYLQIIMKLQTQSESGESSFNILKQPEQILSFVKNALDSGREERTGPESKARKQSHEGLSLADLRIVEEEDEDEEPGEEGDSDDEGGGGGIDLDEEMTSTALNLLLSVLEANPDLSIQTAPILDNIFSILEHLAKESSESIKPLAREALMVLVARLASSSIPKTKTSTEDTPEKKYQKALKLLQDPILPVRAHGLLLLRELVSSHSGPGGTIQSPAIDPALVPGILSIFLQSLQDDDSYIFLNAVQGLSAMVDGFGKEVLKGLVETYSRGLDGVWGVIRRCGDALPDYANILIPPFFAIVRGAHLPATLRTSSLSLLALCVNTSPISVLPYAMDLTVTMVDLLQVETVPVKVQPKGQGVEATKATEETDQEKNNQPNIAEAEGQKEEPKQTKPPKLDSAEFRPTTTSSKIPPLRRAALHLLILMVRAYAAQVDEESVKAVYVLPPEVLRRARTTAVYISGTDEDGIVRVMAKELVEELDTLAETMLGL
ncbi:hypothetical protein NM688_g970 [Phlebia brevispora]|uniref:Uncharacterized protein n=1 Tax=Phlebia brevispora TaxID=194682 RepID=A0ACC1TCU5_9APHY|nr:hypothetical protein NM688_g970 [Phlebia brevispora]